MVYSYAPGRGSEHASALLKNFRGILQTDDYVAYESVAGSPGVGDRTGDGTGVTLAHCWAHCRRRFFDIAKAGSAPIAGDAGFDVLSPVPSTTTPIRRSSTSWGAFRC